jgi:hypothetical protein
MTPNAVKVVTLKLDPRAWQSTFEQSLDPYETLRSQGRAKGRRIGLRIHGRGTPNLLKEGEDALEDQRRGLLMNHPLGQFGDPMLPFVVCRIGLAPRNVKVVFKLSAARATGGLLKAPTDHKFTHTTHSHCVFWSPALKARLEGFHGSTQGVPICFRFGFSGNSILQSPAFLKRWKGD